MNLEFEIKKYQPYIVKKSKLFSSRTGIPAEEFESKAMWAVLKEIKKSKEYIKKEYAYTAIRSALLDVLKTSSRRFYKNINSIYSNAESDDEEIFILHKDLITHDDVLKKEADQRQLIDFLVNCPDQDDPVTTLIVSEFGKYESITALAKALGLHHETVRRKLRKLARHYDANRFGDYREYLAV